MNLTQAIERLKVLNNIESALYTIVVPFTNDEGSILSSDDAFFVYKQGSYNDAGERELLIHIGVCRKENLLSILFIPEIGQVHICKYDDILLSIAHQKI